MAVLWRSQTRFLGVDRLFGTPFRSPVTPSPPLNPSDPLACSGARHPAAVEMVGAIYARPHDRKRNPRQSFVLDSAEAKAENPRR